MLEHRCHLLGCGTRCPRAHLFCGRHWAMVPAPLQREVYRTVRMRGAHVDATWAPWWRAQAHAEAAVLERIFPDHHEWIHRRLKRELDFADRLDVDPHHMGREATKNKILDAVDVAAMTRGVKAWV